MNAVTPLPPFSDWRAPEQDMITNGVIVLYWPTNVEWYQSEVSWDSAWPSGQLSFWGKDWANSKRSSPLVVQGSHEELVQAFIIYTLTGEVNGEKV